MTKTNTLAAKLSVAFVAVAMVFTMFAPATQAQTVEELQAQIAELMAQINQLTSQVSGGDAVSSSSVCPYTWTRTLNTGATGDDVKKLQQFLNSSADTQVAMAGSAGSPGMETSYYGPATGAAVAKFQEKHRMDVLAPLGLVNPTTFFGNSTMAKANALCVAAPTTPDAGDDDDATEDDDDTSGGSVTLGGAAFLDTVEVDDPADSTVEEGDRDVEIGTITLEFDDGDAEVDRMTIGLDRTGSGGEQDPWDTFSSVSIWVDGDMVAEKRADRRSDYLSESAGTLRFTNMGLIAMEGDEVEIVVAADIDGSIRNLGTSGDEWELTFEGLRYFDADGVSTNEDNSLAGSDSAVFTVEAAGEGEEITVRRASSNPASTDIIVDTDTNTDDVNIFAFDIEADDGDIDLYQVVVEVQTPNGTTTDIIRDVELVIDGKTFRDETLGTLANGQSELNGTTSIRYLFDVDGDITIDEDDSVLAKLVVDFRSQEVSGNDRYTNGQQVRARVTNTELGSWEAEGAEDLISGDFTGSATGEYHTLLAEGLAFDVVDISERRVAGSGNTPIDTVEFTLKVDVTAVEDTFYIEDDGGELTYTVTRNGTAIAAASSSATMNASGVTKEQTRYRIDEGVTETFTFTVTAFPGGDAGAKFRAQFDSLDFYLAPTGGTADTQNFIPESDYRTGEITVIN